MAIKNLSAAVEAGIKGLRTTFFISFKILARLKSRAYHMIATIRWKLIQIAGRIVLNLVVKADLMVLVSGIRRRCYEERLASS